MNAELAAIPKHIADKAKPAPKSRLKAVTPKSVTPVKPKFMIVGAPKVGKTWGAIDFPSVYFIDSERGATRENYQEKLAQAGGMYVGMEQGSQSFTDVIEQVKALATEKHDYRTLVIDSFTYLFNLEVAKEAERLGDKDAFGASKKPAIQKSRQLLTWLDRLDMNVILICHEKPKWEKGEQIGVTFDGYDKLDFMLELTLYIQKRGDSRVALVRESRMKEFPMGTSFPWNYAEFASRYGKEVIEKESKPLELATELQLTELNKLLDLIKVSKEEQQKWFAKAGVEKYEEMDADKVSAIITMLKKKIEV